MENEDDLEYWTMRVLLKLIELHPKRTAESLIPSAILCARAILDDLGRSYG